MNLDFEEIVWGYIPLLIGLIVVLLSLNILRKKIDIKNVILTALISLINVFSVYILIQILNNVWPTYSPHIGIGISTILLMIQFRINRN